MFISSFAAVSVPLFINLFITAGIYPDSRPEKLTFFATGIIDCHMFSEIYHTCPVLYCIIYTMLDGAVGGTLGLVAVCCSKWAKSRFDSVALPFVIFQFSALLGYAGIPDDFILYYIVNPVQESCLTWYHIAWLIITLSGLSILITWVYSRRRDVL